MTMPLTTEMIGRRAMIKSNNGAFSWDSDPKKGFNLDVRWMPSQETWVFEVRANDGKGFAIFELESHEATRVARAIMETQD